MANIKLTIPKVVVSGTGLLHLPGTPEWQAIQDERAARLKLKETPKDTQ